MKSRSTKAGAIAFMALAFAVAACGGASEKPAASPADEAAPAAGATAPAAETKGDQPPAPPAMPSTQSAPSSSGGSSDDDRKAELASARSDIDTARRDLEASQGDCTNVCRALTSLERVTAHFCALASTSSDRDACEDAKVRVYKARARIKASCGTCANGAPLDANAPLTSH